MAEKDERVVVAKRFKQEPTEFRLARTLKDIDHDIQAGYEQLLMTPQSRKRAGVVTDTTPPKPTRRP